MTGTEALIALVATSTVLSAAGMVQSASAQASAKKAQAAQAERAALISRQQAAAEEEKQRRLSRRAQGSAVANVGASGITLEGSPLDVLEDSAMEEELDALTIRYNGEIGAMTYESEAAMARSGAAAARTAGYYGAASSLLSGAAKIAGISGGGGNELDKAYPNGFMNGD
jgi:hypothetical protein